MATHCHNTPDLPPASYMNSLLEAMDEFSTARNLVELIAMTARHNPDDDRKAISAGCAAVLDRIRKGYDLLEDMQRASGVDI